MALLDTDGPTERMLEGEVLQWTALLLKCLRLYCEIGVQDLLPVGETVVEGVAIVLQLLPLPDVMQLPGTESSRDSS